MTLLKFLLLGIIYYIGNSTSFTLGIGYFTLYRPVFSGLLTGIILGDPVTGFLAGAIINIFFIGFKSTGGSLKGGDPCLAGIVGAMIAVTFNIQGVGALAVAYPVSAIGILFWKYRLNLNSYYVKEGIRGLKKGDLNSINQYDIYYPQMSLLIFNTVLGSLLTFTIYKLMGVLLNSDIDFIKYLNFTGIILIVLSGAILSINHKWKYTIYFFTIFYVFGVFFKFDPYLIPAVIALLSVQKNRRIKKTKNKFKEIKKQDLYRSWFIWMNFTHSCYSYEKLQGFAFAHSMVPIFKRLYRKNKEKLFDSILRHTDYFNTEPNIGTPIHGYIIRLEEEGKSPRQIKEVKEGLMGIMAGMGDSVTQTVLAPLTTMAVIYGALTGEYLLSVGGTLIMAVSVVYLSLKGYLDGYYYGEAALEERIKFSKNSRIVKLFPVVFITSISIIISKAMLISISRISVDNIRWAALSLLIFYYIFYFLLNKKIKEELLIISVYLLGLVLFIFA